MSNVSACVCNSALWPKDCLGPFLLHKEIISSFTYFANIYFYFYSGSQILLEKEIFLENNGTPEKSSRKWLIVQ